MASPILQFREDPDAVRFLRRKGINPNAFARAAFQAQLRRFQAQEANTYLENIRTRLPQPIERLIQEMRAGRK